MKGLRRFFKRIMGYFQNQKGYTLAEMTVVVAVTATLTALAIPVMADKIQQGKLARAAMDVRSLQQALTSFLRSVAYWPADPAIPADNAPGLTAGINVLFVGTGVDPRGAGGAGATWPAGADAVFNNASSHLVTNSTTGAVGGAPIYLPCSDIIKANCWAGPYIGSMREDPWGNNYLINVQGFYTVAPAAGYGWILSAGPDGVVNTDITDPEIQGDDIGIMAYKAKYEAQ